MQSIIISTNIYIHFTLQFHQEEDMWRRRKQQGDEGDEIHVRRKMKKMKRNREFEQQRKLDMKYTAATTTTGDKGFSTYPGGRGYVIVA